jgi:hypothetical protein
MEIVVYLAELIQNRKQVGIAGLGTLYKSKVPGRYDADTHAFLPPSYTLHFSTELLEKDSLATYISFKRNISVDSANFFIEQFSDRAAQELTEYSETQLGTLGKLSSVEGSVVFEPSKDSFPGQEYFGLPKVSEGELSEVHDSTPAKIEQAEDDFVEDMSADTVHTLATKEEVPDLNEVAPVFDIQHQAEDLPETEKIEEIVNENRFEEENPGAENQDLATSLPTEINYKIGDDDLQDEIEENKRLPYLKITLVAVLVLFILALTYFLYPKMMTVNKEELEESQSLDSLAYLAETKAADSTAYSDSIRNAAIAIDSSTTDTTAVLATTPSVVEKTAVTTYEIIIGSLANMKEANKFVAQMKSKGIVGKVVDSLTNSRIKVSIASFTDHDTAIRERRRIAKQLKDPTIYIYTNKPKR